jgi:hypothetical protein
MESAGHLVVAAQHDAGDLHRLTSCGTAMLFNRAMLLDDDGPVPNGSPDETCLQVPSVMLGYGVSDAPLSFTGHEQPGPCLPREPRARSPTPAGRGTD